MSHVTLCSLIKVPSTHGHLDRFLVRRQEDSPDDGDKL